MNYLYGFLSSAFVYSVLHWAIPDKKFDHFLKQSGSSKELQQLYRERWDITVGQASEGFDECVSVRNHKASSREKVSV